MSAERRWPWRLTVAFVLLTLAGLVTIPWVVQRRVTELREGIRSSEGARTLVVQWQFNLVREMAALTELLLSGDTAEFSTYGIAWSAEQGIHQELAPLAVRLGPDVLERFTKARTLADQWHARVRDEELLHHRTARMAVIQISRERQLFEEVLRAVGAVGSAIGLTRANYVERVYAAERTGLTWTLICGVMALLAAGTVIALEARTRRYAAEAERRRNEADEALAESARADEARYRVMRGITHDVKNPLGAAKGYAELLAMGVTAPLAPEQAPMVEGVERSVDSALAIINDLLDLARVDSGGISVNRDEFDLNDLARTVMDNYRAMVEAAGHVIEADTTADPIIVYTDPVRVQQVLENLLSNATKYTPPPGRIVVRVMSMPDGAGPRPGLWAAIVVSDTGPGIPPEQREVVFQEFMRLEGEDGAKGHGLGLTMARALARRLGGDLTLGDTGPGGNFMLWLPRASDSHSTNG